MPIKDFVITNTATADASIGLFIPRVAGFSLFLKHGLEKLTGRSTLVQHFPDPIHIGAHGSLAFALLSDGICSILVILGLAIQPAATIILINLRTAFFFVHHAAFFSSGHVEPVWLCIVVFAAAFFCRSRPRQHRCTA